MTRGSVFSAAHWAVGGTVVFVVLIVWLLGVNGAREERARTRMAAQRGAFAPADAVEMGRMPNQLREASGLVVSRVHPGVFWTHNDSGDEPRLYAIDATAKLLATFEVEGAAARDWEALALGTCPGRSDTSCLYVADVGDNGFERESVAIYIIEEPDPSAGDSTVALLGTVPFTYPDGPHNAEGLAITTGADLVVVTKERDRTTQFFEIPAADVRIAALDGGMQTLAAGRPLPIEPDPSVGRLVTDVALNSDGNVLAVRTYSEIYFFRWPVTEQVEQVAEACFLGELEPQGEGVAFRDDGRLVLTSESTPEGAGYLQVVRCPGIGE